MTEMDEKTELKKLPPLTLSLIIISFVLVVLFVLGLILPQHKAVENAKNERIAKMLTLEEQKKLFPLYARADALEKVQFEPRLPLVERKPLSREQISSLSSVFQEIALSHHMKLSNNSLDINSMKNDSNLISMDVQFSGQIFDYRNCLVSLAELPYFNAVERISISTDPSNIKIFSTKILIFIDKK
jgi:hypothetical protein